MKKAIWGKDKNHCIFESEHKTYNRKINCPGTGNIIDGGYLGLYVRPWDETECNGRTYEPGHLYHFDMKSFQKYRVPNWIAEKAKSGGILYCLRHYNGQKVIVHGWILTDREYREVARSYAQNSYKSQSIIDTFAPYVTETEV